MKVDAIQALEPTRRTAMGLIQSNFRATKVEADRWRSTTSAHLRGRARQYRLAAALADCPRDEATFCDLAMMFDQLAYDFRRFENERRRVSISTSGSIIACRTAARTGLTRPTSA
jgi:hypothetical protein